MMGYYNHSLSIDATIMVSKNCPITREHVGIIFVTLYVTIAILWPAKNTLKFKNISGCRRVTLNCVLKFAKKKKQMKRSSALSTLQNGSFRKGTLRFSFFFLPYYLSVLIWSYSQVNKYFHIVLITFPFSVWWFRRQKHVLPWCHV